MQTVYLLHFNQSYKHAQHYIGIADDLRARLAKHAMGTGARLMEVVTAAGINWQLARTWRGDRQLERKLKNRKHAPLLCPVCSGDRAMQRAKEVSR